MDVSLTHSKMPNIELGILCVKQAIVKPFLAWVFTLLNPFDLSDSYSKQAVQILKEIKKL